jgi:hypothetical protein
MKYFLFEKLTVRTASFSSIVSATKSYITGRAKKWPAKENNTKQRKLHKERSSAKNARKEEIMLQAKLPVISSLLASCFHRQPITRKTSVQTSFHKIAIK